MLCWNLSKLFSVGPWGSTLSRSCLKSSWGRMEGLLVESANALLVPTENTPDTHFEMEGNTGHWCLKCPGWFRVTFEGFQMLHSFPQDSQFVRLLHHGLTGGDHGRQLVYQVVHFVPTPLLYLSVRFPVGTVTHQSFVPTGSILAGNIYFKV